MAQISISPITPCLWFDNQADEAARFYVSIFDNANINSTTHYLEAGQDIHGQKEGSIMTVDFDLENLAFTALNGGPLFTFTPAVSFFVLCESEAEVDHFWNSFSENGEVMMELDQYDWSPKYGWIKDRYGVSWQISLGNFEDVGQKITPSLLFVSENGIAEQAMDQYTSLFPDSATMGLDKYGAGEAQPEGMVKHAQFRLNNTGFMAMDSSPKYADYTFNEALSFVVTCENQEEIDFYWEELSRKGEKGQCGWLKDQYGVSWQIVPAVLPGLLKDPDTNKSNRVMQAMLQMNKLDINALKEARTQ